VGPTDDRITGVPKERGQPPSQELGGDLAVRLATAAAAGQRVIVNPASGERIVIRSSGDETGGRLLVFDLFLPPGSHVPARHVHPVQSEQFVVVQGRMRFSVGRGTILAGPGDAVLVPPGVPHWFGNAGQRLAHARVEVRPALRMEELLEASEAMGEPRRFLGMPVPRLSALASFMLDFRQEIAAPNVPACVVHAALTPLAMLHRRRVGRSAP
jgi:quercetin dioxygenase-like cupin family protein